MGESFQTFSSARDQLLAVLVGFALVLTTVLMTGASTPNVAGIPGPATPGTNLAPADEDGGDDEGDPRAEDPHDVDQDPDGSSPTIATAPTSPTFLPQSVPEPGTVDILTGIPMEPTTPVLSGPASFSPSPVASATESASDSTSSPSPTPSETVSPSPTSSLAPSPSQSPSPTATHTPTQQPEPTAQLTDTPGPAPEPTPTRTPTPTPTPTPEPSRTAEPPPTPSPRPQSPTPTRNTAPAPDPQNTPAPQDPGSDDGPPAQAESDGGAEEPPRPTPSATQPPHTPDAPAAPEGDQSSPYSPDQSDPPATNGRTSSAGAPSDSAGELPPRTPGTRQYSTGLFSDLFGLGGNRDSILLQPITQEDLEPTAPRTTMPALSPEELEASKRDHDSSLSQLGTDGEDATAPDALAGSSVNNWSWAILAAGLLFLFGAAVLTLVLWNKRRKPLD